MEDDGIVIKKKGRPKGMTAKKSAAKKKVAKKAVKKKAPKKNVLVEDSIPDGEIDSWEKDLESLSTDELDDEAKRAMIRARNEQAAKQRRLNEVAMSTLVEKEVALDAIVTICSTFVERLNNAPDELTPQLHKKKKKEIRDKLVKKFDEMKSDFIKLINEGF